MRLAAPQVFVRELPERRALLLPADVVGGVPARADTSEHVAGAAAGLSDYFDASLGHEDIARRYPAAMRNTTSVPIDAQAVRHALLARGGPDDNGFVRCAYRPFDNRWLYWEPEAGLLARPRPEYRSQCPLTSIQRCSSSYPRAGIRGFVGALFADTGRVLDPG